MFKVNLKKSSNIRFNKNIDLEIAQVRQPSLVDSFYTQTEISADDGEESVAFCNPLYMLMNQERLNRLGDGAIKLWLDSLDKTGNKSLSELKQKCSDDDIIKMTKSRHIQHPSELQSWIDSLNTRAELFNQEVQKLLREGQSQQQVVPNAQNIIESQIK